MVNEMRCPFCQEESFAKKKLVTENWKIVGEVEICALCGAQLPSEKRDAKQIEKRSSDRLAALLGSEPEEKISLRDDGEQYHFCRNCKNFLIHPFKSVCALSDQETDPMGECPEFEAK